MIARNLISTRHVAIEGSVCVSELLDRMNELEVNALPFLNNGHFEGFITRKELKGREPSARVSAEWIREPAIQVEEEEDYFTLLNRFADGSVRQVAVMNGPLFHGTSTPEACALALAATRTATQKGSFLLISVAPVDFSMAEIARIAEAESVQVTGMWIETLSANGYYVVFLKFDTPHTGNIADILMFQGYSILYRSPGLPDEMISERYQSLMKYLDL